MASHFPPEQIESGFNETQLLASALRRRWISRAIRNTMPKGARFLSKPDSISSENTILG
jgi:hypothetical protein